MMRACRQWASPYYYLIDLRLDNGRHARQDPSQRFVRDITRLRNKCQIMQRSRGAAGRWEISDGKITKMPIDGFRMIQPLPGHVFHDLRLVYLVLLFPFGYFEGFGSHEKIDGMPAVITLNFGYHTFSVPLDIAELSDQPALILTLPEVLPGFYTVHCIVISRLGFLDGPLESNFTVLPNIPWTNSLKFEAEIEGISHPMTGIDSHPYETEPNRIEQRIYPIIIEPSRISLMDRASSESTAVAHLRHRGGVARRPRRRRRQRYRRLRLRMHN